MLHPRTFGTGLSRAISPYLVAMDHSMEIAGGSSNPSRAHKTKDTPQGRAFVLVRGRGLEPPWYIPHAPQTCASAGSATLAYYQCPAVLWPGLRILFYQKNEKKSTFFSDKVSRLCHPVNAVNALSSTSARPFSAFTVLPLSRPGSIS